MICEWMGGPDDGALLEIPDGQHSVMTYAPEPFNWAADGDLELGIHTYVHPVQQRFGKHYIVWNPRT